MVEAAEPPVVTPKKAATKFRKHGAKVVDAIAEIMQDDSTPVKHRKLLSGILAQASSGCDGMEKDVRKSLGKKYQPQKSVNRPGRPRNSLKITDDQLRNRLEDLASPTSVMHNKLERPVWTLNCSKRRASRQIDGISKTTLCRRLKGGRMAFSPAACQRGKCDACFLWMSGGRNIVSNC